MEFFTFTLPNGIRCIHKRIKSPVAYCAMTVNTGSRDESTSELGIAHFTEHMLFKGTVRRRAYHINSRLEKLGGELNAFTTKEETVIHATTLKSDISKAADLISDIIFNSVFPFKELNKEREVILDEINSYKDSPTERIYDEFEDLLFRGSSLGHNILGTRSCVNKFRTENLNNFVDKCYNTDQMVFSVAANISEKAFINISQKYFGNKAVSSRSFQRTAPKGTDTFHKSVNRGTHQAHCIVGCRAYDMFDKRRAILSLLINILGGPAANSLLNTVIREKHGLTYAIDASYTPYSNTGISSIYFGTDKDKIDVCMELVQKILKNLKDNTLPSRQLSMAKKQFIGQLSIAMESTEGYMLNAAKSYLVYNEVDTPEIIYRKILDISESDILEVANDIFANTSFLIYNGQKS